MSKGLDVILERAGAAVDLAGTEPTDANVVAASITVAEAKISANDRRCCLLRKLSR